MLQGLWFVGQLQFVTAPTSTIITIFCDECLKKLDFARRFGEHPPSLRYHFKFRVFESRCCVTCCSPGVSGFMLFEATSRIAT